MFQTNATAAAHSQLKHKPDGLHPTFEPPHDMTPRLRQDWIERMSKKRSSFFWMGVLSLVGGLFAVVFPFAATLSVNIMAAVLLVVSGVTVGWTAFQQSGGAKWGQLTLGILSALSGLVLVVFPLVGIFWLTLFLSAALFAEGVTTLVRAFRARGESGWIWIALSGVLSIITSLIILLFLPSMSLLLLGLLLGINLFSAGIAQIVISRRLTPEKLAKTFPDKRLETQPAATEEIVVPS